MKYSKEFEYNSKGVDGVRAFFEFDSKNNILPTKHPNILKALLKAKGSVNLNIKMWKEDYNNTMNCGKLLPHSDVLEIIEMYNCPDWVYKAITGENMKLGTIDIEEFNKEIEYDIKYETAESK